MQKGAKRIVAHFQPQAWINDHAVEIDGDYDFACGFTGSGGGELGLSTPYGETPYYYDLANEWISE